jgi:hypothetical protein
MKNLREFLEPQNRISLNQRLQEVCLDRKKMILLQSQLLQVLALKTTTQLQLQVFLVKKKKTTNHHLQQEIFLMQRMKSQNQHLL